MSHSLRSQGLLPARLLCPWDSLSKRIGVVCQFLLQGIFPIQVSCMAGRFLTIWATREALKLTPYLFFIHSTYNSSLSVSYMVTECFLYNYRQDFSGSSDGKESACHAGDLGSSPGLGRSPGGWHGNPLQYSCLENPHGQTRQAGYSPWCAKSRTWLSD